MTIRIRHFVPEINDIQVETFINVKQIHFIDNWLTLHYDEQDPFYKKFKENGGIIFIEYDQNLDDVLIDE